MKKLLVISTLLITSSFAGAEEATKEGSLTLAAAELQGNSAWVDTQEDIEKRINDDLTEKSQVLLDEVTSQLTQKLEADAQNKLSL